MARRSNERSQQQEKRVGLASIVLVVVGVGTLLVCVTVFIRGKGNSTSTKPETTSSDGSSVGDPFNTPDTNSYPSRPPASSSPSQQSFQQFTLSPSSSPSKVLRSTSSPSIHPSTGPSGTFLPAFLPTESLPFIPTTNASSDEDEASIQPTENPTISDTEIPFSAPPMNSPSIQPPTAPPTIRRDSTDTPSVQPTTQPSLRTALTDSPSVLPTTQPSIQSYRPSASPSFLRTTASPTIGTNEQPTAPPSLRPPFDGYIFCYGDSLTAGINEPGSGRLSPYAPHLEEALTGQFPRPGGRFDTNTVDYRGLPGWTATEMLEAWNNTQSGLGAALERAPRDNVDIVIIMAGTNDVRKVANPNGTKILESIRALHTTALLHPKVKQTLAIEIPPGAYRSNNPTKDAVAIQVNEGLLDLARANPRVHHTPFPFPYEDNGSNWSSDRLHFSVEGYRVLGRLLAPVVRDIVDNDIRNRKDVRHWVSFL